jgi:hypothetical protein
MGWLTIMAIVLAITVITIPIAFMFYLNMGGIVAILDKRKRNTIAKWLFEFERKGMIGWDQQDDEFKSYYTKQVDKIVDMLKYRPH